MSRAAKEAMSRTASPGLQDCVGQLQHAFGWNVHREPVSGGTPCHFSWRGVCPVHVTWAKHVTWTSMVFYSSAAPVSDHPVLWHPKHA